MISLTHVPRPIAQRSGGGMQQTKGIRMAPPARQSGERRAAELLGVVLVVLGVLFLLRNTGYVVIDWGVIWAVLLVVAGVVILGAALRPRTRGATSVVTLPREDARRLDLDLGVGAGTFHVTGGARDLVEVSSDSDDVVASVERREGVARVRLRQRTDRFPWFWEGGYSWDVRPPDDLPVALAVSGGAGDLSIDLRSVRVVDARVSAGAAQVRLTLPRPDGEVRLSVSAGAAAVTIEVPAGVEARVVTSGLMAVDGRDETPGFATARDRVLVNASGGLASLHIVQGPSI
jgi:hypothetical protein